MANKKVPTRTEKNADKSGMRNLAPTQWLSAFVSSRLLTAGLVSAVLLGLMGLGIWAFLPLNAQQGDCVVGQPVGVAFSTGSSWDLCWSVADAEGVLLHQIHFTTPDGIRRQVMKEAGVAQIVVSPDITNPLLASATLGEGPFVGTASTNAESQADGTGSRHYLSDNDSGGSPSGGPNGSLGGDQLISLTESECPDGQLLAVAEKNVLCQQVRARGYIFRYFDKQQQGEFASLFSLLRADGPTSGIGDEEQNPSARHYIIEWRFYDDGTIEPMIGDAGTLTGINSPPALSPLLSASAGEQFPPLEGRAGEGSVDNIGGYVTTVFWRLDIDIGANGDDDIVEQFEVLATDGNTQRELSISTILTETARAVDPNSKRSWRVRAGTLSNSEGHLVSYQLDPRDVGHQYIGNANEPWLHNQFYVTALNACERLATRNDQSEGCAQDVSQFANNESLDGRDIVFWYSMSAHHLPRAEDHPIKRVDWLSFQLVPRDWSASNPFSE